VFQDRWIFELNLLDVVVEIQRHHWIYRSRVTKLGLQELNGLPGPRAHRVGVCVIHTWLDYSRREGSIGLADERLA
jgi:hypothetical protein